MYRHDYELCTSGICGVTAGETYSSLATYRDLSDYGGTFVDSYPVCASGNFSDHTWFAWHILFALGDQHHADCRCRTSCQSGKSWVIVKVCGLQRNWFLYGSIILVVSAGAVWEWESMGSTHQGNDREDSNPFNSGWRLYPAGDGCSIFQDVESDDFINIAACGRGGKIGSSGRLETSFRVERVGLPTCFF